MASTVSERPISGTVPSSSLVAGSDETKFNIYNYWQVYRWQRLTKDLNRLSVLCIDPFPINESLEFDQFWVFQTKLFTTSEGMLWDSQ